MNFEDIFEDSKSHGETNDCAVIAVTAVTKESYEDVLWLFGQNGRRSRSPTPFSITKRCLIDMDFTVTDVSHLKKNGKTVRTFCRWASPNKRYLLRVRTGKSTHILGVMGGKPIDWTGRGKMSLHRIIDIYEVKRESK